MPSWHHNTWRLTSRNKEKLERARRLLLQKDAKGREEATFDIVAPMPGVLEGTRSPTHDDGRPRYSGIMLGGPERVATDEEAAAIRATGSLNWYDWQCEQWGVKWGPTDTTVREAQENGVYSVEVVHRTPWCAPKPFLDKLVARMKADGLFVDVQLSATSYPEEAVVLDVHTGEEQAALREQMSKGGVVRERTQREMERDARQHGAARKLGPQEDDRNG